MSYQTALCRQNWCPGGIYPPYVCVGNPVKVNQIKYLPLHRGIFPFHSPFTHVNFLDVSGRRITSCGQRNSTSLPLKNSFPITFALVFLLGSEHVSLKKFRRNASVLKIRERSISHIQLTHLGHEEPDRNVLYDRLMKHCARSMR